MIIPLERVFHERERSNTWKDYYNELRKQAIIKTVDKASKVAIANRRLNRYSDVLPYDSNRIVLKSGADSYINASYVEYARSGQRYIIAQGPMDITCHHFWRMIWQHNVCNIVMLCKVVENQKCKCAQYWPASVAKDMSFDEFTISLLTCSLSSEYNISTFKISNSKDKEGSERTINHFHYHAWPDFGIPDSPDSFLKFLCLVRQQNAVHSPPPVIHCSAGIGRSGVYAVCDIIIQLLQDLPEREWSSISLDEILLSLRLQRVGLIQAPDQLRFTFKSILRAKQIMLDKEWPSKFLQTHASDDEFSDSDMPAPPPPLKGHAKPQVAANGDVAMNGDVTSKSELRQRKHQETATKVADIRKRMKANENSQQFWNNYWPHFMGIGALMLGTCAYLYFSRTSSLI